MQEGDIVLTPVPQANGQIKNRPALFLREMPPFSDALGCGISTQLHQQVAGFDEIIAQQDADFADEWASSRFAHQTWFSGADSAPQARRKHWCNSFGAAQTPAEKPERLSYQVSA